MIPTRTESHLHYTLYTDEEYGFAEPLNEIQFNRQSRLYIHTAPEFQTHGKCVLFSGDALKRLLASYVAYSCRKEEEENKNKRRDTMMAVMMRMRCDVIWHDDMIHDDIK